MDLSVIIVTYNTSELTQKCLKNLLSVLNIHKDLTFEVIVVDNASTDDTLDMLKKHPVKTIISAENLGFGAGNNIGLQAAQGKYILYLNTDVMVEDVNFRELIDFMETRSDIGVLTVKVNLPSGEIDPASHRGFPTLWRSFTYFTKLEFILGRFLPFRRLLGGYHLLHKNFNETHEIDSPTGAFYLTRREIVEKLRGFDEDYFMYGEDLDLSYRIKKLGFKVMYYPTYSVVHLKHQSGLKTKKSKTRSHIRQHFYESMKIFYRKHYARKKPELVNSIVYSIIDFKKKL